MKIKLSLKHQSTLNICYPISLTIVFFFNSVDMVWLTLHHHLLMYLHTIIEIPNDIKYLIIVPNIISYKSTNRLLSL